MSDIAQHPDVAALIRRALAEDVGPGDATTLALVPAKRVGEAVLLSRGAYVAAGLDVAQAVFAAVEPRLVCEIHCADGQAVAADQALLTVRGPARGILTAERTALNFVQRLMGIATLTRAFVEKVAPHGVDILDTRKTTPTLRTLEKYAVRCGGGRNHRMGLFDMILIKDNHRFLWGQEAGGDLGAAVQAARRAYPGLPIEVEVESEEDLTHVLDAAPDWVLLDNMTPERLRRCVALCAGRCRLEASGGVTLANVEAMAATGVNAISIGALTHSAPAADLSLEWRG